MVELETFEWASAGIEPRTPEDAVYSAGEQPIAGYDNFAMWAITSDLRAINDYAANHGDEHESGGSQQINLNGLSVGTTAKLEQLDTNQFGFTAGGNNVLRFDTNADVIRSIPSFGVQTDHREGINLADDITRNADGSTIYDYGNNRFHRAEHALEADWADDAGDSALLAGNPPSAFIQEDDDTVEPTGKWNHAQSIDANIDGHAQTAGRANTAGHADTADEADTAGWADDSGLLDGGERALFAELAADEAVSGHWAIENDAGLDINSRDEFVTYNDTDITDYMVAESVGSHHIWMPHPNGQTSGDDHFGYSWNDENWLFNQELYVEGDEKVATENWVENHESLGLQADDDVQITGNWDYTQIIGGTVEHAQEADHADHADDADFAQAANFAAEAEYATDSDKLDGHHASDIIDMARSGSGEGRWTFLDATDMSTGSNWEYTYNTNDEYDQYKVFLVHDLQQTSTDDRLWLRINSDTRSRYYYFKHNRIDDDYFLGPQDGPYWPVCISRHGYPSYGEYIVSQVPSIDGNSKEYPTISRKEFVGHPRASGGTLQWGYQETEYNAINEINVQPNTNAAARIVIWGSDIPSP